MTKAKSKICFCCCNHAKEFNGMFAYSDAMNRCFQSITDAVMKYKWVEAWKDEKVINAVLLLAPFSAKGLHKIILLLEVTPPPGTAVRAL